MITNDRWDVIVVGAGPAGSALAIRLAAAGLGVLLLERARLPRDKLCGEFVSAECWPVLGELGVAGAVAQSGYHPIRGVRLWLSSGAAVDADLPVAESGPAIGLSRAHLDHLLLERARERGAAIAEGTEVVDLVRRADRVVGVRVRFRSAGAGGSPSEELRAKVVVAADGRRSQVVRQSGRIRMTRGSSRGALCAVKRHYRVGGALDPQDRIELASFAGGYAGICRVEGAIVNFCSLLPIPLLRAARGNIERALARARNGQAVARSLARAEPLSEWKTIPEVRLQRSHPLTAGVLYVGDAMGTIDPLGGEGIAMALDGSRLAAGFVERAVTRAAGCDRAIQQRYDQAWRDQFRRRIEWCRRLSWLLAQPQLLANLLRGSLRPAWSHLVLPWAYRVTRGPCMAGRTGKAGTQARQAMILGRERGGTA